MTLRAGYLSVATKLQESADAMMHGDVRSRLSDAINDAHRGTGNWGSYIDHSGDGESGDVIYSTNGDIRKASYEIGDLGGKATTNVDTANSKSVVPVTTYEEEADDDDQYAAMTERFKAAKLYTALPLYERFISKGERDKADGESFAGKGKSFPILKPGDVMAAVRSMGRAGSDNYGVAQLKANIIRIAKAKGWTSELPKSWQGDEKAAKEAAVVTDDGSTVKLSESVPFPTDIPLREAFKPSYQIKLIAPGKGSSAFYPAEVLKRDGPKVFKAGTPMRIDHPTMAEESARPEGSVKDWGAVLAKDAVWIESHKEGPGLYGEIKPFSDHVQTIEEKGPYAGVSIRASGHAVMESGKPVMKDGVPVLARLTAAEGVDMVTRAGAGGMFLSESARRAISNQEVSMTESDVKRLIAEGQSDATKKLLERALRGDATVEANRILQPLGLRESGKQMVVENVIERGLPLKDGELDVEKFTVLVTAEAKRVAAVVSGHGGVTNMGTGLSLVDDPKAAEARVKEAQAEIELGKLRDADELSVFESLMPGNKKAAEFAAKGRAA